MWQSELMPRACFLLSLAADDSRSRSTNGVAMSATSRDRSLPPTVSHVTQSSSERNNHHSFTQPTAAKPAVRSTSSVVRELSQDISFFCSMSMWRQTISLTVNVKTKFAYYYLGLTEQALATIPLLEPI